jgi:galactokinase
MRRDFLTPNQWMKALHTPAAARQLSAVYGPSSEVLADRVQLLRRVLDQFGARFGDVPVRVFRCPARVNLRGMHVDTHGGFLNLTTHQRETVIAACSSGTRQAVVANIDPQYPETLVDLDHETRRSIFTGPWLDFISAPEVTSEVDKRKGAWSNYVKGALLSAQHRFHDAPLSGMNGVVGSDIPQGAALSSSAALCVAVILSFLGCNGKALGELELIQAGADAEWYTGARSGLSDQAAMVLGDLGEMINVALFPPAPDLSSCRRLVFPEQLTLLVIDSGTRRSLSGAELAAYTRNRFVYSLALDVARQELAVQGAPPGLVDRIDRLPHLSPGFLEEIGGLEAVYRLLAHLPLEISLNGLRERYGLSSLDAHYRRYFDTVPPDLRPQTFSMRGPLAFGIAESERARLFIDFMARGNYEEAGRLMSIGHDGDRRVDRAGRAYENTLNDRRLTILARSRKPIYLVPGVYGASSPVLDSIVDVALDAGALGASLTGAGIAGTVVALCRAHSSQAVAEALRHWLGSREYAALARRRTAFTKAESAAAVVENHVVAPACELTI